MPAIGPSLRDEPSDFGADERIVDGLFVMRAQVHDVVSQAAQRSDQVLLERKPGMVGADRNAHDMRL